MKKIFKYEECKSCEFTVGKSSECDTCDEASNYGELWNADENCVHNIVVGNGIRCTKCKGWFCF